MRCLLSTANQVWTGHAVRRVYRQRADVMVFLMLFLVGIGVAAVWSQTQDDQNARSATTGPQGPATRLHVSPTTGAADAFALDEATLADMPYLAAALAEAQETGHATIEDAGLSAAVWAHFAERGMDRHDVVVRHGDEAYRIYEGL